MTPPLRSTSKRRSGDGIAVARARQAGINASVDVDVRTIRRVNIRVGSLRRYDFARRLPALRPIASGPRRTLTAFTVSQPESRQTGNRYRRLPFEQRADCACAAKTSVVDGWSAGRLARQVCGESRNRFDHLDYLRRRDQPRAFELPWRAGVARAPEKIPVIETMPHVVPATVADMPIDHAPGRGEFVGWMGKAADQHDPRARRPREPG